MIGYLRGLLRARTEEGILLDVAGVGYDVSVSSQTASALPPLGRETEVFVHTQVREDAITLFGFHEEEERVAFRILLEVNGIGPRLALSVLSTFTPRTLAQALATSDVRRLTTVPGIGKRTAERMVLELKEKLPSSLAGSMMGDLKTEPIQDRGPPGEGEGLMRDLTLALQSLGYRKAEMDRILRGVRPVPGDSVESLLRRALKDLTPGSPS